MPTVTGANGNSNAQFLRNISDKLNSNDELHEAAYEANKSKNQILKDLTAAITAGDEAKVEGLRDRLDAARRIMQAVSEMARATHEMMMALIRKLSLS